RAAGRAVHRRLTRSPQRPLHRRGRFLHLVKTKRVASLARMDYFGFAQFRTCLWPCVGRWASGQEAGQPPKEETTTSLLPRPAAGGEPAMPALHWRRGLKQRRKGFFGYCRRQCRGRRKGLSIFANSAERDFPNPDRGSNHGDAGAPPRRGSVSVA